MEAEAHPDDAAPHLLLVLDGSAVDDGLIAMAAYSAALTGGRVSYLLLAGGTPSGNGAQSAVPAPAGRMTPQ
ncbi:MAG: hypothetical protein EHM57_01500 [Actinobacteria bacterium]|nr:MAG: hypothetical protein EHM57_01500 [Actinomycetota bacterium]